MGTEIQKHQEPPMVGMLKKLTPAIAAALPRHLNPDRMCRIALTALRATPKLAQCTQASFLGAIIQASQLGLELNTPLGHAWLIPFKKTDKRTGEVYYICQLVIGYQGFMDLARRSGSVSAIYAFPVYQGDEFRYELGLEPTLKHVPKDVPHTDKALTHVYAVAKLKDGEPVFTVLTRAEVERYRSRSRSKDDGPWVTDYEAMAVKTGIRRLSRWVPRSAEMAIAAAVDESIETGRSQLSIDPEVAGVLQAEGVDTSETDDTFDPVEASPAPAPPDQDGKKLDLEKGKGKGRQKPQAEPAPSEPPPLPKDDEGLPTGRMMGED
jgi:recombination protein RecT